MFIEQIMIFALGFLVAGLLSLLFLPAFWRRAMTLSRRQLEMQMPLSMAEIVAERDQLRAEFAAEQRRLEQRLEQAQADRASAMLAQGQRGLEMVKLGEALKTVTRDAADMSARLALAERDIVSGEAELSTTLIQLYDVEAALERRNAAFAELVRRHEALNESHDEQRTTIAGLETRLSGQEADIEDLLRRLKAIQIELADARDAGHAAAHERDQFQADVRHAHARRDALQAELEEERRRLAALADDLRRLERDKARLAAEIKDQAGAIAAQRAENRDLADRLAARDRTIGMQEETAAQQADLARASLAAVEGALDAQRRETEKARADLAKLREEMKQSSLAAARAAKPDETPAPDYAALRRAIASIGGQIATLAEQRLASAGNANSNAPAPPSAAE